MNILICGQNGQVARELHKRLSGLGELHLWGRDRFDMAKPESLREVVRALKPGLIVNAAAHTAVDQAESEPELAYAINAEAPGVLAEEAARLRAPLIHYSTDYVFDGSKDGRYHEDDPTGPLGVYGQSKLAGEKAIRDVGVEHLILRTSWVYSNHGKNFLLTMQRLLQEKEELRIVADQIGAPTWAGTIAASTRALIDRWQAAEPGQWGIYHLTAGGETSWFGFAEAIAAYLREQGKPCARLVPIPSSEYPTPAARPLNSRLDCSKLVREWGVSQPLWQDALQACFAEHD